MRSRNMLRAVSWGVLLAALAACGADSTTPFGPPPPPPPPELPPPAPREIVDLGVITDALVVEGSLRLTDGICTYPYDFEVYESCHRYRVTAPSAGTIAASLSWSTTAWMSLLDWRVQSFQYELVPPLRSTNRVAAGESFIISVGLHDPQGNAAVDYQLMLSFTAENSAPRPRVIEVGQAVNGRISSQDRECRFSNVDGGWAGLCNAFDITPPANGVLSATVRWAADAPLALFLKTSAGKQIDLSCCKTPMVMQLPVEGGVTYRIELAYVGRPAGYPQVPPVDYTLETALLPSEAPSSRALQAIVFGDQARTQRLSHARLEVLDGPSAGTVASFDEATGLYEFASLPAGFVQILVSADGFTPLTERLPVGTNLPRELVLQRRETLPNATNTLSGITWADASRRSAHIGVKIEILDGPLAGVFTFTDQDFGVYYLSGLPPGLIQIRASSEQLQPQTLSVVISGDTRLDFFMQPR